MLAQDDPVGYECWSRNEHNGLQWGRGRSCGRCTGWGEESGSTPAVQPASPRQTTTAPTGTVRSLPIEESLSLLATVASSGPAYPDETGRGQSITAANPVGGGKPYGSAVAGEIEPTSTALPKVNTSPLWRPSCIRIILSRRDVDDRWGKWCSAERPKECASPEVEDAAIDGHETISRAGRSLHPHDGAFEMDAASRS